jgi:hypothetical protein
MNLRCSHDSWNVEPLGLVSAGLVQSLQIRLIRPIDLAVQIFRSNLLRW